MQGFRSQGCVHAMRVARWLGAVLAVVLAAPAVASATDYTVNDDTSGSGPAGSHCATPDFSRVEQGIIAAAPGDTLLVCDGTYTEPDNQILVEKGITVIGNGRGNSILDGQNATGLPSAGFIRTNDNTAGNVTFRGFTIRNAGQNGTGASTARFAVNLLGNDPGFTFLFDDIRFEGRGTGGRDYGFYGQNADQDVTLRNSTFVDQAFNPILIERVNGVVTIEDNVIDKSAFNTSGSIFAFTHSSDNISKTWTITDNTIDNNGTGGGITVQTGLPGGGANPATLGPVVVTDNEISEYATNGVSVINTSAAANGLNGLIDDVTIGGNTMTADAAATSAIGMRLQGLSNNVDATGNRVTGVDRGISIENGPGGHSPTNVNFAFNRLADSTTGLRNATASNVTAENNWWGCNEGPSSAANGCAPVVDTSTGVTDFDPWIVLGVTASPASIEIGGSTSSISLSMAKNSAEATPAGNVLPGPFAVALSTDLGSIAPATVSLDAPNWTGSATLTSGATAGTATVTASVDAADPTAQVVFTDSTPPPPPPPGDKSADLSVSMKGKPRKPKPGRKVKYKISVRNAGPDAAAGAVLTGQVSKSVGKVKAGSPCVLGKGKAGKRKFTCDLGEIAAGSARSLKLKATLKAGAKSVKAKVRVTSSTPDPNGGNNAAKVRLKVRRP